MTPIQSLRSNIFFVDLTEFARSAWLSSFFYSSVPRSKWFHILLFIFEVRERKSVRSARPPSDKFGVFHLIYISNPIVGVIELEERRQFLIIKVKFLSGFRQSFNLTKRASPSVYNISRFENDWINPAIILRWKLKINISHFRGR